MFTWGRWDGFPDVAKVVDFGLVKEITTESGDTGRIFGTPSYLAPEVITQPDQLGPATDLYGVGAVGYFLVTGRRVFEGTTDIAALVKHVGGTLRSRFTGFLTEEGEKPGRDRENEFNILDGETGRANGEVG